jgi:hypothetical protein
MNKVAATAAVLILTILCPIIFHSVFGGLEAAAQATGGPSKDAPPLSVGQRVERPFGAIEISKFSSVPKQEETIFTIEFLIRNEGQQDILVRSKSFRLIADGIPRAPLGWSGGCGDSQCDIRVKDDSAEYGWATFDVRGQPHDVYLQIGTPDEGRSYLRWPK